jgi:hypothetical protein
VRRLDDASDRAERLRRLTERKNQMTAEVEDLESQLNELARESRREQPEAARELQEASRFLRDARVADKIRYSRGVAQGRSAEYAETFEEQIAADLENLEGRVRAAADAMGESREQRLDRALEQARDLAQALESLEERARESAESGAPQQGQQAQQGQQGQGGQGGRQGQQQGRGQGGPPRGAGGGGQLAPEDARQFARELGERRRELEELQRQLEDAGVDAGRLSPLLRELRSLDLGEPLGRAALGEAVIPGLREFEYVLRRSLRGAGAERLFLSGADEVPPEYRELVEEYYRALARSRRQ